MIFKTSFLFCRSNKLKVLCDDLFRLIHLKVSFTFVSPFRPVQRFSETYCFYIVRINLVKKPIPFKLTLAQSELLRLVAGLCCLVSWFIVFLQMVMS